jgi:sulfate permease, SulP family
VLVLVVGLEAIGAAWLALIPKAAIAGLLMLVAWTLVDGAAWRRLAAWSRPDFIVAAVTALAMLVLRLEAAILLGAGLSLVVHLYRSSQPAMRSMGFASRDAARQFVVIEHTRDALPECPQLKLLRMEGSVWFGATAHVQERLEGLRRALAFQPHLLVMSKSMNDLDLAGAELWAQELRRRRAMGGDLYFHRPRPPVLAQWERTGFLDALGRDHVFPDKRIAIASIFPRLDAAICRRCTARIFEECGPAPAPAAGPGDDPH